MKARHCTETKLSTGMELVMVPGPRNIYGLGLYFTRPERYFSSSNSFVFDAPDEFCIQGDETYWLIQGRGLIVRIGEKVGEASECIGATFEAEIVDVISPEITYDMHRRLAVRNMVSVRTVRAAQASAAMKTNWFDRLVGLALAVACTVVGAFKLVRKQASAWKWVWLARFLSGVGGEVRVPDSIAKSGMKDLAIQNALGDDKFLVRPQASTELFWMVGGFTATKTASGWEGRDVYDFHPQPGGQGVQAQAERFAYGWAWSGDEGDPSQIPAIWYRFVPKRYRGGYVRLEGAECWFRTHSGTCWVVNPSPQSCR